MPCGQNKQTTTKPENPESNYTRKFLAPCRAAFLFYLKYLPHKNSEISHNCSDSQLLWKPKRSGQTKPIFLHGTYDQNAVTVAHLARMPIPVCWPLPGPCVHIVYQPGPENTQSWHLIPTLPWALSWPETTPSFWVLFCLYLLD